MSNKSIDELKLYYNTKFDNHYVNTKNAIEYIICNIEFLKYLLTAYVHCDYYNIMMKHISGKFGPVDERAVAAVLFKYRIVPLWQHIGIGIILLIILIVSCLLIQNLIFWLASLFIGVFIIIRMILGKMPFLIPTLANEYRHNVIPNKHLLSN